MALRDRFDQFMNFFGTDDIQEDVLEYDDEPMADIPQTRTSPSPVSIDRQASSTKRDFRQPQLERTTNAPRSNSSILAQLREDNEHQVQASIALKYPREQSDAKKIVDLLIENESVLIDFQYMSGQEARRCIDFIDGATFVLAGKLQKVSNTMYLLTPVNVSVDIEEINATNADLNFDYDIKTK